MLNEVFKEIMKLLCSTFFIALLHHVYLTDKCNFELLRHVYLTDKCNLCNNKILLLYLKLNAIIMSNLLAY